uniref:Triacylglycerol lipase n=1 Tax=Panagrolaimus davidi TaxID=227884 RepID=A0A914PHZ2_9BILA
MQIKIRRLIEAVYNYTDSKVDIIAHSLGAAVSRKAILGGKCVDTNETIGDPLTFMIDTFISLAGVAYGAESCPIFLESCNEKNGFNCKSGFIHDINAPNYRYEGDYSYYIYSNDDLIIGKNCCGHFCPELKNATDKSEHNDQNHLTIVSKTIEIQYTMLTEHFVIKDEQKDPK